MDPYNYQTRLLPDMPNSEQSSPSVDELSENQSDMFHNTSDKRQSERISDQPLLFGIDYILNLAVKEQRHQHHNYLSHLAQIQQYQHHCQQLQLQQQQQYHNHLHQQQGQQQLHEDKQKLDSDQAQDCRKKKTRTVFTKPQVMHLESVFRIKKYLTCFERSQLANSMNLSETQIKIWFQNRRNKFKREHHISHLGVSTTMLWNHSDPIINKSQ